MGIDHDAGHAENIAEDDIGALASDAGQTDQGLHIAWHFTAVFGNQYFHSGADILGLLAKKSGLADILFQFPCIHAYVVFGAPVFRK